MEKKRCKVVMLPTTEKSRLFKGGGSLNYLPHSVDNGDGWRSPQHLYIISDDKIEEGDWVIETSNSNALEQFADYSLNQKSMGCKKIIATTDSELKLPQIPQSFIEEYCRKGGIDEVDVEYEMLCGVVVGMCSCSKLDIDCQCLRLHLKVNSSNEITIHPIKDTYTREEVYKIAKVAYRMGAQNHEDATIERFDKFIKENL